MKLEIRPISYHEAAAFVNANHRHNIAPNGGKFCIAVHDEDGVLHGVAICGRPIARKLDDGLTLEITRVCTDGAPNACSMLYGASVRVDRAMGYRKVITYTLTSEPGASLKASNFSLDGEAGGRPWTNNVRTRNDASIPQGKKFRWSLKIK